MLTLEQRSTLSNNGAFLSRVKGAVCQHAADVLATTKPDSPSYAWAAAVMRTDKCVCAVGANLIHELCANDVVVKSELGDGSDIEDDLLLKIVGSICENYR